MRAIVVMRLLFGCSQSPSSYIDRLIFQSLHVLAGTSWEAFNPQCGLLALGEPWRLTPRDVGRRLFMGNTLFCWS